MTLRELINIIGFQIDEPAMRKVESQTQAMFERMKNWGEKMSMRVTAPLVGAATMAVNSFTEYNTALALVKLRLDAVGESAQFTVQELDAMSQAMSAGTLYEDEKVLKDVSATLLMFGNISRDVFTRSQEMAIDLAAAMEVDLKSAALFLGKALENPAENMDALSRAAKIKFTPAEKDMLAAIQATSGAAAAQAKLLDILEKRNIKGTARAIAEASSGFKLFMKQVDEVGESFGKILFPYFRRFWGLLADVMKKISELPDSTKRLLIVIAGIVAAVPAAAAAIGSIGLAVTAASTAFAGFAAAMSAPILIAGLAIFAKLALVVLVLVAAFLLLDDAIQTLGGKKTVLSEILIGLTAFWDQFERWLENLAWIKEIINLIEKLGALDEKFRKWQGRGGFGARFRAEQESNPGAPPIAHVWGALTGGGGLSPSPAAIAGAQTSAVNVTVNQTLPPGTPERQAEIVKQSTEEIFKGYINGMFRDTLANYPAAP
jgi:hypothetical protein